MATYFRKTEDESYHNPGRRAFPTAAEYDQLKEKSFLELYQGKAQFRLPGVNCGGHHYEGGRNQTPIEETKTLNKGAKKEYEPKRN